MAKDYGDGVWRTINGRRVFIAEGQSLGDAMKKSGKFGKVSKVKGVRKNTFKDEISQGDKNRFAMGQGLSKEAVKGYAKARQDEREKSDKVDVPGFKGYEYDKKTGEVKSKDYSEKEAQDRVKDVEARNKENQYGTQDKIKQDVLEQFGEDFGYDNNNYEENLKSQIDYMRNPGESIHKTAERFVEGGGFLIYNDDIKDYLKENGVKFNDDNFFDKYKKDMADKIEKLYNSESPKKPTNDAINKTIKEKTSVSKQIPRNLSKDIYELDVDKGNAWSGDAPVKNANGDKYVRVRRNGQSQNSSEDIANAITKKYPHLDARVINDREVDISVKKSTNDVMNDTIRSKADSKYSDKEIARAKSIAQMYDVDRETALRNVYFPKDIHSDIKYGNTKGKYDENEWKDTSSSKTKADRNIDAMEDKETRRRVAEASNKEIKQILAENQKQKNNEYMSKVAEESGKNKESGVIQRAVSRMTPQQKAKTFEARLRQRGQNLDEERAYYTQDRMNKIIDKQNMSDKAKASARQNLNTWKPAKNDQELRNRYSEDIAFDKGATPNASKDETRNLNNYKRVELNRIKNMLSGEKVYDTRNGKNVGDARNLKEDKESTSKIMNNAIRNRKVTKAYENYIKKHPNSKITLSEFKDLYQG